MKRYLLFLGEAYYPEGGWDDFLGHYDTEDEVLAAVRDFRIRYGASRSDYWAHAYDTETGLIRSVTVARSRWHLARSRWHLAGDAP